MFSNLRLLAAACALIAIRLPASSLTHLSVQARGGCVKRDAGATSGGTIIWFVLQAVRDCFLSCICSRASPDYRTCYLDPLILPTSYSSLLAGR